MEAQQDYPEIASTFQPTNGIGFKYLNLEPESEASLMVQIQDIRESTISAGTQV